MADEKKNGKLGAVLDGALGAVKLDWVRPLIWKVGGRKMAMGGGAVVVIQQIALSSASDSVKIAACAAITAVAIGAMFSVGWEDGKVKANGAASGDKK